MMKIEKLDSSVYTGKRYHAEVYSDAILLIERSQDGFTIRWKELDKTLQRPLEDQMLSSWLDDPIAFGVFEDDCLLGFVEGFFEKWNQRYRITNICVFDANKRHQGIGSLLMNTIENEAKKSEARMIVLETQNYNQRAIYFYQKHGYKIIGFDLYAYSNDGPFENNIRIEMGKKLIDASLDL